MSKETKSKIQILTELKETAGAGWLPRIYEEKVRAIRTRAFQLGVSPRENNAEILHTLLGVELKVGKRRVSCPDLAAARFLQVFARIGCSQVAIPYDITKISLLADELESAWQRVILLLKQKIDQENVPPEKSRSFRAALVKELRKEIDEIGAGEAVPQFNQNTKQRRA
jgi:hypothetical protein